MKGNGPCKASFDVCPASILSGCWMCCSNIFSIQQWGAAIMAQLCHRVQGTDLKGVFSLCWWNNDKVLAGFYQSHSRRSLTAHHHSPVLDEIAHDTCAFMVAQLFLCLQLVFSVPFSVLLSSHVSHEHSTCDNNWAAANTLELEGGKINIRKSKLTKKPWCTQVS